MTLTPHNPRRPMGKPGTPGTPATPAAKKPEPEPESKKEMPPPASDVMITAVKTPGKKPMLPPRPLAGKPKFPERPAKPEPPKEEAKDEPEDIPLEDVEEAAAPVDDEGEVAPLEDAPADDEGEVPPLEDAPADADALGKDADSATGEGEPGEGKTPLPEPAASKPAATGAAARRAARGADKPAASRPARAGFMERLRTPSDFPAVSECFAKTVDVFKQPKELVKVVMLMLTFSITFSVLLASIIGLPLAMFLCVGFFSTMLKYIRKEPWEFSDLIRFMRQEFWDLVLYGVQMFGVTVFYIGFYMSMGVAVFYFATLASLLVAEMAGKSVQITAEKTINVPDLATGLKVFYVLMAPAIALFFLAAFNTLVLFVDLAGRDPSQKQLVISAGMSAFDLCVKNWKDLLFRGVLLLVVLAAVGGIGYGAFELLKQLSPFVAGFLWIAVGFPLALALQAFVLLLMINMINRPPTSAFAKPVFAMPVDAENSAGTEGERKPEADAEGASDEAPAGEDTAPPESEASDSSAPDAAAEGA